MLKTAWQFMRYDRAKTIGALLGVVIANFLIGQQTGIFSFLTGMMSSLVDHTTTGLWVVDTRTTNVNALAVLDMRVDRQLESIPGVWRSNAVVISGGNARFADGQATGTLLIGSEAPRFALRPWNLVSGKLADLVPEGAVSTDVFDRKNMGGLGPGGAFEINGHRVYIATQSRGARGFGAIYVFTTIERVRAMTGFSTDKANAFLIDLQPGANPVEVREAINRTIPGVRAWLPEDFSRATVYTVLSSSGIAISTGTMIVFAIISGFVIIGLTLYSAAVDRLKDYATMKAIGARNGFITRLILTQAFLIATSGFAVGAGFIEAFRRGIANSGALFHFPPYVWVVFYGITLFISLGGAFFAIRRIAKAEPASVFRA